MLVSGYRLCENVRQITLGTDLAYTTHTVHDLFSDVMVFDVDVFCSFVINVVCSDCLSTF